MSSKIIQIIQWLIIVLLAIGCFYFWKASKNVGGSIIDDAQFNKNDTQYVSISNDKTIEELKKVNKELYDSIKKLSDVKEAIQIKYIVKYKTDTVYIGNVFVPKDSVYHYSHTSDTIDYNLDIKGKKVEWFKLDFAVKDSLMLITRSKNNQNETTITHTTNTTITDATVFVPKKSFLDKVKENLYLGVGVGAGYGVFNRKPDIYIGINAGVKF